MPNIVNLSEVKSYLNIETSNSEFDSILNSLIASVTSEIEVYCKQPIAQANVSAIYKDALVTPNDIALRQFPVGNLVSISYKSKITEASWTSLDVNDFAIYSTNKLFYIQSKSAFNKEHYYNLTYQVGFASVPEVLKQVAFEMVSIKFTDSKHDSGNLNVLNKTTTFANSTVNENSSKEYLSKYHKNILNSYRIPTV
jgi:hypothetical protein